MTAVYLRAPTQSRVALARIQAQRRVNPTSTDVGQAGPIRAGEVPAAELRRPAGLRGSGWPSWRVQRRGPDSGLDPGRAGPAGAGPGGADPGGPDPPGATRPVS